MSDRQLPTTPPTCRRWLQFAMVAMLLAMVISNLFVFWLRNHSVVYQRQVARGRTKGVLLASEVTIVGRERARIPAWRTMFGDEAIALMWLRDDASAEEATRMVTLFPEAEVRCPPFWTKVAP
jgi:hypothetical protein